MEIFPTHTTPTPLQKNPPKPKKAMLEKNNWSNCELLALERKRHIDWGLAERTLKAEEQTQLFQRVERGQQCFNGFTGGIQSVLKATRLVDSRSVSLS